MKSTLAQTPRRSRTQRTARTTIRVRRVFSIASLWSFRLHSGRIESDPNVALRASTYVVTSSTRSEPEDRPVSKGNESRFDWIKRAWSNRVRLPSEREDVPTHVESVSADDWRTMKLATAAAGARWRTSVALPRPRIVLGRCKNGGGDLEEDGIDVGEATGRRVYAEDAPPLNQVTFDWVQASREAQRERIRNKGKNTKKKKTRDAGKKREDGSWLELDDVESSDRRTAAGTEAAEPSMPGRDLQREVLGVKLSSKTIHRFNTQLMRMESVEEILDACSARQLPRGDGISVLNVVAALESLVQIVRREKWHPIEKLKLTRDQRLVALMDQAFAQKAELKPRGLARLVWSLAGLGGVPKYRTEMEMLLRRAEDMISEFTSRDLSNILWALATTKHRTEFLSSLAKRCVECGLSTFKAKELCSAVWAFASLNYHPGREFMDSIPAGWELADGAVPSFTSQQLTNCLWALAILGEHETPLFQVVWEEILRRGPSLRDNKYSLLQVHQVLLLDSPRGIDFSSMSDSAAMSRLRDLGSLFWEKEIVRQARQVSFYQRQVSDALGTMGLAHVEEDNVSGISVDITIPTRNLAIEVDGPSHLSRTDEVVLGHTVLKQKQLRALGWDVLNIPYYEWDALLGREDKRDYLLARFDDIQDHSV